MNNILFKFFNKYSFLALILLLVPFILYSQDSATNISGVWWRTGITGPPGSNISVIEPRVLSDFGTELMNQFDPIDDPAVRCEHPGAVRVILSPYPIKIEKNISNIIIQYEEWATTRNIPFNNNYLGFAQGEENNKSVMGKSVAFIQDGKLIIKTNHLSNGLGRIKGQFLWLSDKAEIVEEYSTNQDQMLVLRITINDPVMLEKPFIIQKHWGSYEGELLSFDCIDRERPQT